MRSFSFGLFEKHMADGIVSRMLMLCLLTRCNMGFKMTGRSLIVETGQLLKSFHYANTTKFFCICVGSYEIHFSYENN